MKKIILAVLLIAASVGIYSFVTTNKMSEDKSTVNSTVSFYTVPLVCGAAPEIGCGSKAKPILTSLESKNDAVSEVWLNRPGTVIAVVWKENAPVDLRTSLIDNVFSENKMKVAAIPSEEEEKLLADFTNKKNWYHNSDVDKLSIEEAGVIAERLISRVNAETPLSKEKAELLQLEFAKVFTNRFTKNYGTAINTNEQKVVNDNKKQIEDELLSIGQKFINEKEAAALKKAVALGYRPTEEEKNNKPKGCCSKENEASSNSAGKCEKKGC